MELIGLLIQNTGKTQSPVNMYQVTSPSNETSSESEEPLTKPVLDHDNFQQQFLLHT